VEFWYSQTAFEKQAKVLFHLQVVLTIPRATLPQISLLHPIGLQVKVVVLLTIVVVETLYLVRVVLFWHWQDSLD